MDTCRGFLVELLMPEKNTNCTYIWKLVTPLDSTRLQVFWDFFQKKSFLELKFEILNLCSWKQTGTGSDRLTSNRDFRNVLIGNRGFRTFRWVRWTLTLRRARILRACGVGCNILEFACMWKCEVLKTCYEFLCSWNQIRMSSFSLP
jgi:hypothetical protein